MADKLMSSSMTIHKITTSVDYNLCLKRLNIQLYEPNNQNSLKTPKLISQRIRKTLETRVINSPMSPPSLTTYTKIVALKYLLHKSTDFFSLAFYYLIVCKHDIIVLKIQTFIYKPIIGWYKQTVSLLFHQ